MKLADFVAQSIYNHPSLFLTDTYEHSRLLVLNQAFLVLGNGMEWAHCKRPAAGGYLTHDRNRKFNGEWVRCWDQPYGKQQYTGPELSRFWQETFVEISHPMKDDFWTENYPDLGHRVYHDFDRPSLFRGFAQDAPEELLVDCVLENQLISVGKELQFAPIPISGFEDRQFKTSDFKWVIHSLQSGGAFQDRSPYPFTTRYWPLAEIELQDIKPDWRQGAIDVLSWALNYYQTRDWASDSRWSRSDQNPPYKKYFAPSLKLEKLLKDYELPPEDGLYLSTLGDEWAAKFSQYLFERDTISQSHELSTMLERLKELS